MTVHCYFCGPVVLDAERKCPECGSPWRDPEDGPSERQIEQMMDAWPARPFTMADKDDPDGYRP